MQLGTGVTRNYAFILFVYLLNGQMTFWVWTLLQAQNIVYIFLSTDTASVPPAVYFYLKVWIVCNSVNWWCGVVKHFVLLGRLGELLALYLMNSTIRLAVCSFKMDSWII